MKHSALKNCRLKSAASLTRAAKTKEIEMRCIEMLFKVVLSLLMTLMLTLPSLAAKPLSDEVMSKQVGQTPITTPDTVCSGENDCDTTPSSLKTCAPVTVAGVTTCQTVYDEKWYSCVAKSILDPRTTSCTFPATGFMPKKCLIKEIYPTGAGPTICTVYVAIPGGVSSQPCCFGTHTTVTLVSHNSCG